MVEWVLSQPNPKTPKTMSALFGIGVLGGLITDDPENICRVDMRVSETRLHSRVLDGCSRMPYLCSRPPRVQPSKKKKKNCGFSLHLALCPATQWLTPSSSARHHGEQPSRSLLREVATTRARTVTEREHRRHGYTHGRTMVGNRSYNMYA